MKLCSQYHKGLYTWTRALRTFFVYTEFTKKNVFEKLTVAVASPVRCRHGRQKVSIPECDLTGRRVTVVCSSSLHAIANVSCSKTFILVYENNVM